MFRSNRSGASQRWIGVNRPGSDTGADYSPSARRVGAPPGLDAALDSGPRHPSLSLGDRALPLREGQRDLPTCEAPASYRLVGGRGDRRPEVQVLHRPPVWTSVHQGNSRLL